LLPIKILIVADEHRPTQIQMTDVPAVSTFSASGEDAITRTIQLNINSSTQNIAPSDFLEIYEIERTVTAIIEGNFKRVSSILSALPRLIIAHTSIDISPVS
jgi:hypothetical protein